jgi:hypothetical protein
MSAVKAARSAPTHVARRLRAAPPWLLPAGAVLFVILFLLPALHAPFFSDDVTASNVTGYRKLSGKSFLGFGAEQVWNFVVHSGRPQIFSNFPGYPVFTLLGEHPAAYHAYILGVTALDGVLIYGLLRRLRAPAAAAALAIVLAAAWMQFRIYHDSMISFSGLVQTVLALVAGSLWCFTRWLDEGRRRDLVLAVALFFVACGIYEVAYPLCLAHVTLALAQRRGRAALRAAVPFVGVAMLFGIATLALRHVADSVATGYTVGAGGPWTILRTYAVQLISPLPAMSIVADPSITGDPDTGELFASVWRGLAVAAAVAAFGSALPRRPVRWAPIVAVGAGFYLGPPVLLSFAGKYQVELNTSTAYLPVLMQVFGLAILATAAFGALLQLAAGRSRAMVAGVIAGAAAFAALSAGVTAFNNIRVIGIIQPDRAARQLVDAAAGRGAFDALPAGTSVFFSDHDLLWEGPTPFEGYLYAELMLAEKTGRAYDARMLPAVGATFAPGSCARLANPIQQQPICAPPAKRAAWARVRLRPDGGTVIVAPLANPSPTGFPSSTSQPTLIAYRQAHGSEPDPPHLVGRTADGQLWTSDGLRWRRRDGAKTWALYSLDLGSGPRPIASSLDDDRGFIDFLAMPSWPLRARLMNTRHLLP